MHTQQLMGTVGRSHLVSSDSAPAMWSGQAWCQFLERQADASSGCFNSHFYISNLTYCKSTCMCLPLLSRFWLLHPCCSFYRITMYLSEQQHGGGRRSETLIKGPRLKLLSGSWVRHWNPNPWGKYLWLTGLKTRSLESLSTKSPFEMTISVLVVCCGLLKGQEHLSWEWKALCSKGWLREELVKNMNDGFIDFQWYCSLIIDLNRRQSYFRHQKLNYFPHGHG